MLFILIVGVKHSYVYVAYIIVCVALTMPIIT